MPDLWRTVRGREVSRDELDQVAQDLLAEAGGSRSWLFFGEMGSGKTTLIKAICRKLGVTESMSSPTFSLINEYEAGGGEKIFHIDLYRIRNEREAIDIGMEECLGSKNWCFVEWSEKLGTLTPVNHLKIKLTSTGPDHRKIEYLHA